MMILEAKLNEIEIENYHHQRNIFCQVKIQQKEALQNNKKEQLLIATALSKIIVLQI